MANNENSDYSKKRMDLFNLLPTVHQSDANRSIFENTFNRFLSKPEVKKVSGFIGQANPGSELKRQIQEPTVRRQAYQLQPLLYSKVGTVDHMAAYTDILNEIERVGVDIDRLPLWGNAVQFNWVPPIDINKLLNFRDYYWVDEENPSSTPQYITIKSECTTATALVSAYQQMLDQIGGSTFIIKDIDAGNNTFTLDGVLNEVFIDSFIFTTKDSTNASINNAIWTTVSSTYDSTTDQTTIVVAENIATDTPVDGIVSLDELFDILRFNQNCICEGSSGWDEGTWDDNQIGMILWSDDVRAQIIVDPAARPTSPINGNMPADPFDLWWDTTTDRLYQLPPPPTTADPLVGATWTIVYQNFSSLIEMTDGTFRWNFRVTCQTGDLQTDAADQWIDANKWVHKNDVESFGLAKRADLPIIEFFSTLELNEWTVTEHKWKYRVADGLAFQEVDGDPFLAELIPLDLFTYDVGKNEVIFDERYGDMTDFFQPGTIVLLKNSITGNNGAHEVVSSHYAVNDVSLVGSSLLRTRVIFDTPLGALDPDDGVFVPVKTSQMTGGDGISHPCGGGGAAAVPGEGEADTFVDYNIHWLYCGRENVLPINHQTKNAFVDIIPTSTPIPRDDLGYVYQRSPFAQEFTVNQNGTDLFILDGDPRPGATRTRRQLSLKGTDDIRVYRNDVRVLGDYDELSQGDLIVSYVFKDIVDADVSAFAGFAGTMFMVSGPEASQVIETGMQMYVEESGQADGRYLVASVTFDVGNNRSIIEIAPQEFLVSGISPASFQFTVDTDATDYFQAGERVWHFDGGANAQYLVSTVSYDQFGDTTTITVTNPDGTDPTLPAGVIGSIVWGLVPSDLVAPFGELTATEGDPDNNAVFTNPKEADQKYVAAVRLNVPANITDVIRIEVGEASQDDIGRYNVLVRTEADNNAFTTVGPQCVSLIRYRKIEQVKVETNQYPLFDLYNIDGTSANRAEPIIEYATNPAARLNSVVDLRIVTSQDGRNFGFMSNLVTEDNGPELFYRDYNLRETDYWVNAWENARSVDEADRITVGTFNCDAWELRTLMGRFYAAPIVSEFPPTVASHPQFEGYVGPTPTGALEDGILWFDVKNRKLYCRDNQAPQGQKFPWVEKVATLGYSDPMSSSMWRPGNNKEEYVPAYVNEDREPVEVGSEDGDWELANQLYFNPCHENKKCFHLTQLVRHINTIIDEQVPQPGVLGKQRDRWRTLLNPNYGLGGSVHDYNDSYDSFLSATFVNNVTVPTLIEWAQEQYEVLLNQVEEQFREDIVGILTNLTTDFRTLEEDIPETIIDAYENILANAFVYFDSIAFRDGEEVDDPDVGIRNWIATLPMLCQRPRCQPFLNEDPKQGLRELVHHDGHRSNVQIMLVLLETIIQRIINTQDPRTGTPPSDPETLGRQSMMGFPTTYQTFVNPASPQFFSEDFRSGVFWFEANGPSRRLWHLLIDFVQPIPPPTAQPDGVLWLDTNTVPNPTLYELVPVSPTVNSWQPVSAVGNGRIVEAWSEVDISELFAFTMLETEQRLYDISPIGLHQTAFDYSTLQVTPEEAELEQECREKQFLDFIRETELTGDPLSAEGIYDATLPFTWNYVYSTMSVNPQGFTGFPAVDGNKCTHVAVGGELSFPCMYGIGNVQVFLNGAVQLVDGVDFTATDGMNINLTVAAVAGDTYDILDASPVCHYQATGGETLIPCTYTVGSEQVYVQASLLTNGVHYTATTGTDITLLGAPATAMDVYTIIDTNLPGGVPTVGGGVPSPGGVWQDLYYKLYGTPFPHLEPWTLQGYKEKPLWWDEEYAVEAQTPWEIIDADETAKTFTVLGDITSIFIPGFFFRVQGSFQSQNDGTYSVATAVYNVGLDETVVTIDTGPVVAPVTKNDIVAPLGTLGDMLYPDRRWIYQHNMQAGMWENIRRGIVPAGYYYPDACTLSTGTPSVDGQNLTTYVYFSVNIGDIPVDNMTGMVFGPDCVLPPFWDYRAEPNLGASYLGPIRSCFFLLDFEIVDPGADYMFGDRGFYEWLWFISTRSRYDELTCAYIMQPVRFLHYSLGEDQSIINCKQMSIEQSKPYTAKDAVFHGDLTGNGAEKAVKKGLLQWYVNYNRYTETDMNASDFRPLWSGWSTPLAYQFGSFIDTTSLFIQSSLFDITSQDYEVLDKKSPGIENHFVDAFNISVTHVPPSLLGYNTEAEWRFLLDTISPLGTTRTCYGTENYPFRVDPETSICTIYQFDIVETRSNAQRIAITGNQAEAFSAGTNITITNAGDGDAILDVNQVTPSFTIAGDITAKTTPGALFNVTNSVGDPTPGQPQVSNSGMYTVISGTYVPMFDHTIVAVNEPIPGPYGDGFANFNNNGSYTVERSQYSPSLDWTLITLNEPLADETNPAIGVVTADFRKLPWTTGDEIYFFTTRMLPAPLSRDTQYNVIVLDETRFRIAEDPTRAALNDFIYLGNVSQGQQSVARIRSTFFALAQQTTDQTWYHCEIDKTYTREIVHPRQVNGAQNMINIMDGCIAFFEDAGFRFNESRLLQDPDNGRLVSWQYEEELFLDFIHRIRRQVFSRTERYDVDVDVDRDTFTFTSQVPMYGTGQQVIFLSNGALPPPLLVGEPVYYIRISDFEFAVAATLEDARAGIAIDILTEGSGQIQVQTLVTRPTIPAYEVNAFTDAVWFRPTRGIVADVGRGPFPDVRIDELVYDQNGNPLRGNQLKVFRQDKLTEVRMKQGLQNRNVPQVPEGPLFDPRVQFLHISGAQLFLDGYEHVILFKDCTEETNLIYDRWAGLNTARIDLEFDKQPEFTQRPNLGGHFLTVDGELKRNMEAAAFDLQTLYDTFIVSETLPTSRYARNLLDYGGVRNDLLQLRINPKSQFLFYRGLLHYKGTEAAVDAFTQSRRFVSANIDEYWAYEIAQFGDADDKEYPSVKLFTVDARDNELVLRFLDPSEEELMSDNPNITFVVDPGLNRSEFSDRWHLQPTRLRELSNTANTLWFGATVDRPIDFGDPVVLPAGGYDVNPFEQDPYDSAGSEPGDVFLRHDYASDGLVITYKLWPDGTQETLCPAAADVGTVSLFPVRRYLPNTGGIRVYRQPSVGQGRFLNPITEFTEFSSSEIQLVEPIALNDKFTIIHQAGILKEIGIDESGSAGYDVDIYDIVNYDTGTGFLSEGQYERVNAKVVRFPMSRSDVELLMTNFQELTLHATQVSKAAHNPVEIIDSGNDQRISLAPIWDPARGRHYHLAENIIDFQNDEDVALYTNSLNPFEVIFIECPADVAGSLGGTYWRLWSANDAIGYYVWYNVAARPEVTTVTCPAEGTPINLGGTFWRLYSSTGTNYHVWYDTGGSSDPGATLNPIPVVISPGDDATTVAIATAAAIDALPDFTVPVPGTSQIVITDAADGPAFDAIDGDAGVTIDSIVQGVIASVDPIPGGTPIQIDLTGDASNFDVAVATAAAIDSVVDFSAPTPGDENITITLARSGATTDPSDFDAGIVVTDIIQSRVDDSFWHQPEVGQVWLDTSRMQYTPYYDDKVFPSFQDRLDNWGRLADWAQVKVYDWFSSDVPPDEYNAQAAQEEGDLSIDDRLKKSGTVRSHAFRRDRDHFDFTVQTETFSTSYMIVDNISGDLNANTLTGLNYDHSQSFRATGGETTFRLTSPYIAGFNLLAVQVNGQSLPATLPGPTTLDFNEEAVPAGTEAFEFTVTSPLNLDDLVTITVSSPNYGIRVDVGQNIHTFVESGTNLLTYGDIVSLLERDVDEATFEFRDNTLLITSREIGEGNEIRVIDAVPIGGLPMIKSLLFTGPAEAITALNQIAQTYEIAGDQTGLYFPGTNISVVGSTGNDGNYIVDSAVFAAGFTTLTVQEAIPDNTVDGSILRGSQNVPSVGPNNAGTFPSDDSAAYTDDGTVTLFTTTTTPHTFEDGDVVLLSTTLTLPNGLEPSTEYTITESNANVGTFKLLDENGEIIEVQDVGEGTHTVADTVWPENEWRREVDVREDFCVVLDHDLTAGTDELTGVDQGTQTFTVAGDQTGRYAVGERFDYTNADNTADPNIGTYTAVTVTFTLGITEIVVTETVPGGLLSGAELQKFRTFILTKFDEGDEVQVFTNGRFMINFTVDSTFKLDAYDISDVTQRPYQFSEPDYLDVIRFAHEPTEDELAFNPDETDDGATHIQYVVETDYSVTQTVNDDGTLTPTYFFWVENSARSFERTMSPRQAQRDLAAIPLPYSVMIDPRPSERVLIGGEYVPFPERYRTIAVRGLRGLINSDDRYIMRFTRDFTLRNEIRNGEPHGTARNWIYWGDESNIYNNPKQADIDLKTLHREWLMFRENQINSVPNDLWVKLTEAVVGNKLGDPSTRVPALAAELYDLQFGTQERIGLQDGQAFVDRETGLNTILSDLNDPNNDFKPVDVETFLLTHTFDTPENIEKSMIDMYNTFDNVSVNRIFFKCLHDAFTFQDKYQGMMKTSMVSINGVRILEVNGVFDD